jgi:uncharacterized cupin superfamily protein
VRRARYPSAQRTNDDDEASEMTQASALLERTVEAVIDLRAYAEGVAPGTDWFAARAAPAFADAKVAVSAVALRGAGAVDALATDEFVLVLRGRLEIDGEAGTLAAGAEDGIALPVGAGFRWRASDDLLAIVYAATTDGPGSATAPLLIDKRAALGPSNPPAPENLLGPTPVCRGFSDYVSANREFACGTWDSTPYHRRRIPYKQVELMLLLQGRVTFSDDRGSVTFGPGDVFLFVRGDGCAWRSEEHVKKLFAIQRPVA